MTHVSTLSAYGDSDIQGRIAAARNDLGPQELRAADFILAHESDLAVFTATEIAESSGVSKATVSRLFRRLGFADAQEVREQARALRSRGVPVAVGPSVGLAEHLRAEHAALDAMVASLADGRLERAAAVISAADEVVVVGFRNSYPVALHLRQQLAHVRAGVRLGPAPGQSIGEELAGLSAGDAVVLVGFRRRPRGFAAVLATLRSLGVPVVVLADPGVVADALVLTAPVASVSPFDSYAAPMSLANLLAAAVLAATPPAAARVAAITQLYSTLGELE